MTTLITGADGYLGSRLLDSCLRAGEPCIAWVHADGTEALARKRLALSAQLRRTPPCPIVGGDLRRDDAFATVGPGITGIVHAAALTRFDISPDQAQAVNVDGTRRLLAFAANSPGIERIDLLGSLYAAGLATGAIAEARLAPRAWANAYEESKWRMEELAHEEFPDLPWRIFRLGAALADDASGAVSVHNAVHQTLKLFFYGLLSVVPGDPACPIYLQSATHTVAKVQRLRRSAPAQAIVNACGPADAMPTLGGLIARVFASFAGDASFRRAGILSPLFIDQRSFERLADDSTALCSPLVAAALRTVRPFSRQLSAPKYIATGGSQRWDPGHPPEAIADLVDATCRHLVTTRWGRAAPAEAA